MIDRARFGTMFGSAAWQPNRQGEGAEQGGHSPIELHVAADAVLETNKVR